MIPRLAVVPPYTVYSRSHSPGMVSQARLLDNQKGAGANSANTERHVFGTLPVRFFQRRLFFGSDTVPTVETSSTENRPRGVWYTRSYAVRFSEQNAQTFLAFPSPWAVWHLFYELVPVTGSTRRLRKFARRCSRVGKQHLASLFFMAMWKKLRTGLFFTFLFSLLRHNFYEF